MRRFSLGTAKLANMVFCISAKEEFDSINNMEGICSTLHLRQPSLTRLSLSQGMYLWIMQSACKMSRVSWFPCTVWTHPGCWQRHRAPRCLSFPPLGHTQCLVSSTWLQEEPEQAPLPAPAVARGGTARLPSGFTLLVQHITRFLLSRPNEIRGKDVFGFITMGSDEVWEKSIHWKELVVVVLQGSQPCWHGLRLHTTAHLKKIRLEIPSGPCPNIKSSSYLQPCPCPQLPGSARPFTCRLPQPFPLPWYPCNVEVMGLVPIKVPLVYYEGC